MAIKDYNSSNFKNTAMDRLSGRFGKGPGDGAKKSSTASSTIKTATLENPWSKPKVTAVTAPTVKKPASTPMPAAKPSTNVSTVADKTMAPAAPKKTMKEVKSENKIKKAEAKGNAVVNKINKNAAMTDEEKAAKRERTGKTIKNIGAGISSAILGGITILNETEDYKAKKASNKPG